MDMDKIEAMIVAEVKKELPRCFVITKHPGDIYIVTIDPIEPAPTYFQLKEAINLLSPLSGRIGGIVYDDVAVAFASAYEVVKAEDPTVGARNRRLRYETRFKGL